MRTVITSSLIKRRYLHIILPTFIGSVIAYLDRVNIAYEALSFYHLNCTVYSTTASPSLSTGTSNSMVVASFFL